MKIVHNLRQTVTLKTGKTVDRYNEPTWATSTNVKARFTLTDSYFVNEKNERQQADATCILDGKVTAPSVGDKVIYLTKEYFIAAVKGSMNLAGVLDFTTLQLTKWI